MSHHIYHTDSFVLAHSSAGEAGNYIYLFTRELGLLGAKAQGVRLLQSKLRYSLQDFSRTEVSLVRGKEIWRLTGAKKRDDIIQLSKDNINVFKVWARIFSLLKRLLTGEEKNERLFDLIVSGYDFILSVKTPKDNLLNFETLIVLRILQCLGYFGQNSILDVFAKGNDWSNEELINFEEVRRLAIPLINEALKETQL
jgi:DNA repair protein RecO